MECIQRLRDISSNTNKTGDDLLYHCRKELSNEKLTMVWEKNGGRIIIYPNRFLSDGSKPLIRHCNGIILEQETWKIIAYPSAPLSLNYNVEILRSTFNASTILAADDGTTVLLYHWCGTWRISTNKAYDVTHMKPFGIDMEYMVALKESLAKYPEFSFDNLDTELSYAIGFHHCDYHPFSADTENHAWFIDAFTKEGKTSMVDIHVPRQSVVEFDSLDDLLIKSRSALDDFLNGNTPVYGYLLDTPIGRFLLESTLMREIRNCFYNNYVIKQLQNEPSWNKLNYVCLMQYTRDSKLFTKLFPQYKSKYSFINETIKTLCADVLNAIRCKNAEPKTVIVTIVENNMRKIMSSKIIIAYPNSIQDYILSENMINVLYDHLYSN